MSNQEIQKKDSLGEQIVGGATVEYARLNSRLASMVALLSTLCSLAAIVGASYIARTRNHVAAVPVGQLWEFPMVHWANSPNTYDEKAKPQHVALKYVRGLYEVDSIDFSEVAASGSSVLLSNKIAELLAYTIPGTNEYMKVNAALEKSQTTFQIYNECRCQKRFLVSDIMFTQPPMRHVMIQMIGRYVMFGTDGRRPLAAEDLGIKLITLYMSSDITLFDRASNNELSQGSQGQDASAPKAVNPEGWYVIKSQITTLKPEDVKSLRQIRADSGMKGIY